MSAALHRLLAALDHVLDRALLLRPVAGRLVADMASLLFLAHADGKAIERVGRCGAGTGRQQRRDEQKTKLHMVNFPDLCGIGSHGLGRRSTGE